MLVRMEAYLATGTSRDLPARLERLEPDTPSLPLLRILEQSITTHGLVPLRPTLDKLVERLEPRVLEIALFERVNCGKSSLLNRLFGADVLPVGVTSITAVPSRIHAGPQPGARIGIRGLSCCVIESSTF